MCIAIVKNEAVINSLFGSPNETFDTPRDVLTCNLSVSILTASSVTSAWDESDEIAIASGSKIRSFLSIPKSFARLIIFSAISILFSAVSGIPSSSSVRHTTSPPYFLARGNISFITSSFPFTELIIAFPL